MKKLFTIHFLEVIILSPFVIINIFLTQIPLVNVLGYEFSVLNAVIGSLLCGIYIIVKHRGESQSSDSVFKNRQKIFFGLFIFLPLIVSITSTVFLQQCPFDYGILFYLIITLPAYFIGVALSVVIMKVVKRFKIISFVIVWIIILFLFLDEIYFNPQIYFYNAIIGFFPGTVYDENITISLELIIYRVFNLFYFGILFWGVVKILKSTNKILFLFLMLVVAIIFSVNKQNLNLASTYDSVAQKLRAKIVTENFEIIYDKSISRQKINTISLIHEFYYHELSNVLDDSVNGKVISFIFKDENQKKDLFGSKNANVAKPWLGQIFIDQDDYRSVLKHELAHIFSANYGWSLFKVARNFNPAMIEGFAMALENNFDDQDINYVSAFALNSEYAFPIDELFSSFNFFSRSSSVSYVYAGSFIRFLTDVYGIEKVKKVYETLDFKAIYGKDLRQLSSEFLLYLKNYNVESLQNKADLYFGRLPVQKKFCARAVAKGLAGAWDMYGNGAYSQSIIEFEEIYGYSGAYSALIGYLYSLVKLDNSIKAEQFLVNEVEKFNGSSYYFNLILYMGDLFGRNKNFTMSDSMYTILKNIAPTASYQNIVNLKLDLLRNDKTTYKEYLVGSNFDKYQILNRYEADSLLFNLIPIKMVFSKSLEEDYEQFMLTNSAVEFNSTYSSAYAAFVLSKYALDSGDYNRALFFAEESVKLKSYPEFLTVLEENLYMTRWIKEKAQNLK